jgi:hypothetical protein
MWDAGDKGLTRDDVSALFNHRLTAPELDDLLGSVPGLQVLQRNGSAEKWLVTSADPAIVAQGTIADRPVILPRDLPDIEYLIDRYDVALVVVDVLMAYLDGKVNSFKDQDVRQVLAQLATVADRTSACVVFVRHLNKAGGPNPLYRGGGSIGIIGAARAGFVIATDPDDENDSRRVFACVKSNLAPMPPALSYVLEQDPMGGVARVSWRGTSNHTAADILRDSSDDADERVERNEAAVWLRDYLTAAGGCALARDAIKDGVAAEFTKDAVKKARIRIKAHSDRQGFGGKVMWTLPEALPIGAAIGAVGAGLQKQAPTAPTGHQCNDASAESQPMFALDDDLDAPI